MREVTFSDINNLNISPFECIEWATEVIKKKNTEGWVLPHKISIAYGNECYFNTMPCYIPCMNLIGLKEVSRITGRKPTLQGDILLYDSITGNMKCLMDGTWITTWRTAAVASVTVETLKKKSARSISLMGLGNIARAFVICIDALRNHEDIELNILAYKNQHKLFIDRFREYKNIHVNVFTDVKEMFKISDVIVSCVTAATSLFDENDKDFKPGVLIVPVQTRGFQNCDLTFDKIFCDDITHISGFKYFNSYKFVMEMTDVLNNILTFERNEYERYIAYNIGIAIQDLYFAAKIMEKIGNGENSKNASLTKFWV